MLRKNLIKPFIILACLSFIACGGSDNDKETGAESTAALSNSLSGSFGSGAFLSQAAQEMHSRVQKQSAAGLSPSKICNGVSNMCSSSDNFGGDSMSCSAKDNSCSDADDDGDKLPLKVSCRADKEMETSCGGDDYKITSANMDFTTDCEAKDKKAVIEMKMAGSMDTKKVGSDQEPATLECTMTNKIEISDDGSQQSQASEDFCDKFKNCKYNGEDIPCKEVKKIMEENRCNKESA